jgi:hypothetical protein
MSWSICLFVSCSCFTVSSFICVFAFYSLLHSTRDRVVTWQSFRPANADETRRRWGRLLDVVFVYTCNKRSVFGTSGGMDRETCAYDIRYLFCHFFLYRWRYYEDIRRVLENTEWNVVNLQYEVQRPRRTTLINLKKIHNLGWPVDNRSLLNPHLQRFFTKSGYVPY